MSAARETNNNKNIKKNTQQNPYRNVFAAKIAQVGNTTLLIYLFYRSIRSFKIISLATAFCTVVFIFVVAVVYLFCFFTFHFFFFHFISEVWKSPQQWLKPIVLRASCVEYVLQLLFFFCFVYDTVFIYCRKNNDLNDWNCNVLRWKPRICAWNTIKLEEIYTFVSIIEINWNFSKKHTCIHIHTRAQPSSFKPINDNHISSIYNLQFHATFKMMIHRKKDVK